MWDLAVKIGVDQDDGNRAWALNFRFLMSSPSRGRTLKVCKIFVRNSVLGTTTWLDQRTHDKNILHIHLDWTNSRLWRQIEEGTHQQLDTSKNKATRTTTPAAVVQLYKPDLSTLSEEIFERTGLQVGGLLHKSFFCFKLFCSACVS